MMMMATSEANSTAVTAAAAAAVAIQHHPSSLVGGTVLPETVVRPLIDQYIKSFFARTATELDDTGQTPLVEAAECGDETSVFILLQHISRNLFGNVEQQKQQLNENQDSWHNRTALHMAAMNGHLQIAHLLLQQQLTGGGVVTEVVVEQQQQQETKEDAKEEDNHDTTTTTISCEYEYEMKQSRRPGRARTTSTAIPSTTTTTTNHHLLTDIEKPDCVGWTPLVHAIVNGQQTMALLLLQYGAQYLHWKDASSRTMLHFAADEGHTSLVTLLLERGGLDINARDCNGWTALHYALAGNNSNHYHQSYQSNRHHHSATVETTTTTTTTTNTIHHLIQILLQYGADVNAQNATGKTPLQLAVLHYSHSRSTSSNHNNTTNKDEEITTTTSLVQLLLRNGAHITTVDNKGRTALHLAAMDSGLWQTMSVLLHHGAPVNARDDDDCTALHIALRNIMTAPPPRDYIVDAVQPPPPPPPQLQVMRMEAEWGRAITATSTSTSVGSSGRADRGVPMVELLLYYGADVTLMDEIGRTPLHYATTGHKDIYVHLLLMAAQRQQQQRQRQYQTHYLEGGRERRGGGGGVSTTTATTSTGSSSSSSISSSCVCSCINVQDRQGRTPLHNAVRRGEETIVRVLLQNGADRNMADESGWTALHFAADIGRYSLTQLLLTTMQQQLPPQPSSPWGSSSSGATTINAAAAADPTRRNRSGHTPLDVATSRGFQGIVQLLQQHQDLTTAGTATIADSGGSEEEDRTE